MRTSAFPLMACLLVLLLAPAGEARSQGKHAPGPWRVSATTALNLSQSSFTSNWAGGDRGSISWVVNLDSSVERQFSSSFHWTNLLQLAYGQVSQQEEKDDGSGDRIWGAPQKSTDLILLESTARFTLGSYLDPYLSVRLDSQFLDESFVAGEILFNPVKLTETGGLARVLHKSEKSEVLTRLGFGLRQTLGRTFSDLSGTDVQSFSTNDGGIEWQTQATHPFLGERVMYRGKLLVFLPLFYSRSRVLADFDAAHTGSNVADFWKEPDINFQNTLVAQITKVVSVNLYVQFVYDKFDTATNVDPTLDPQVLVQEIDRGIRRRGQLKQTLALGLTYKFF